ncbi:MAG: CBS domain-containing protein [Acidobacteriota bacterium]
MDKERVKDLMVPIDQCAVVDRTATLYDAIIALDEAQKKLPPGRQPYRAVLVIDEKKNVVGKIGQLAFLKALEPKYNVVGDLEKLARAGVSSELISSMMDHYRLFQDNLSDLCRRSSSMKVQDVMHPVTEGIDENAPLSEAIHQLVVGQTLSVLVTRGGKIAGLLRLSDLFDVMAEYVKAHSSH